MNDNEAEEVKESIAKACETWKPKKTVIDTDLLIDLLRNQKEATAFITKLEEK